MGSNNSAANRRQNTSSNMTTENAEPAELDDIGDGEQTNLQAIIAYLIRSGQVRILSQSEDIEYGDLEENEEDEDDTEFYGASKPPKVDPNPDLTLMQNNDLKQTILQQSGRSVKRARLKTPTITNLLYNREIGMNKLQQFSPGDRTIVNCQYLPNHKEIVASYHHKAFCGSYSTDGNIFLSASQDQHIRIYDTTQGRFDLFKSIRAKDVGWSILDTAFSPDGCYLAYSSWSDCIHLCNIYGDHETHDALHLFPGDHSFCLFSLTFSSDNREILGGANDGNLYVFDRESNQRTLRIDAHEDDINAVAFADSSSHILFSGGDDGLVKVWDRRTLTEDNPNPVGTLAGHYDGITYIDSKGDARYLVSNSKDQTIKLWDMRNFSSSEGVEATKKAVSQQRWDYRWQQVPKRVYRKKKLPGDTSIMTYKGHSVLHTLIRCHFSPEHTTGQRYIYAGCATGSVVIFDVLTGKVMAKLSGHRSCVRDVSWHPYTNTIMSTSWDGTVGKWDYISEESQENEASLDASSRDDSDDENFDFHFGRHSQRRQSHMSKNIRKKDEVCVHHCGLLE